MRRKTPSLYYRREHHTTGVTSIYCRSKVNDRNRHAFTEIESSRLKDSWLWQSHFPRLSPHRLSKTELLLSSIPHPFPSYVPTRSPPSSPLSHSHSRIVAHVLPTPVPRPHPRVETNAFARARRPALAAICVAADDEGSACAAAGFLVAVNPEGGEGVCWATGVGG
jgi:hypothetical protein